MKELYIGKDGIMLEWRQHVLTNVLTESGANHLTLEPVLHSKTSLDEYRLRVNSTGDSINWNWGRWFRVKANRLGLDGGWTPVEYKTDSIPRIEWFGQNILDAVELTPFDQDGLHGATIRIERPRDVSSSMVEIVEGPERDSIRLKSRAVSGQISAWVIRPCGGDFKHRVIPITSSSQIINIHNNEGRCVIAIVCQTSGRRELLNWRQFFNGAWQNADSQKLLQEVRPYVEQSRACDSAAVANRQFEEWLGGWPCGARDRLTTLQRKANSLGYSALYIAQAIQNPAAATGLYRAVVLRLTGVEISGLFDQTVVSLNAGEFTQSLKTDYPSLSEALCHLNNPGERSWACQNHNHSHLVEASTWAKDRGEKALSDALSLAPVRAQVQRLMGGLHPDSALDERGKKLLSDFENFFSGDRDAASLRTASMIFEADVKADAGQPVKIDGSAPSNDNRHAEWEAARTARRQWRDKLAQVAALCAVGVGPEINAEVKAAQLVQILRSINKPAVEPRAPRDQPLERNLKSAINWLLDKSGYENDAQLKKLAEATLQNVILPNANLWGPLHQDIRQARELAEQYPDLAKTVELNKAGELNRLAQSAHSLFKLVEAMLEFTTTSRVARERGRDRALEIFSRFNHGSTQTAFEEAERLKLYFQSSSFDDPNLRLPKTAPLAPKQLTADGFRLWWQESEELYRTLNTLRDEERRYLRTVREYHDLDGVEMENYCASPSPNAAFVKLYRRCFANGAMPCPKDYKELLEKWKPIKKNLLSTGK